MDFFNFNSVENVPGFETRTAFTLNSAIVFKEDVDIIPTIVDETLSYIPWGGDNQLLYYNTNGNCFSIHSVALNTNEGNPADILKWSNSTTLKLGFMIFQCAGLGFDNELKRLMLNAPEMMAQQRTIIRQTCSLARIGSAINTG